MRDLEPRTAPPVVIAGLYLPGVGLLRDFERRGIRAVGVDSDPAVLGFRSRFGEKGLCPDPVQRPEAWADHMLALGRRLGPRSVLLTTADKFVAPMEACGDALAERFAFPRPGGGISAALTNKRETFRLAAEHGFPAPRTCWPRSEDDLRRFARDAAFPCLLKPEFSTSWAQAPRRSPVRGVKAMVARSEDELLSLWSGLVELDPRLVAQEVIPGPDENLLYFVSYLDRRQEMLGCFAGRKARVVPIHFGSASFVVTTSAAELEGPCHEFLRAVRFWGVSGIEVKRDVRDGIPKLVEVNPRYGMWDGLGRRLGVDIGYIAYRDLLGLEVDSVRPGDEEWRWISVKRDVRALLEYRREGLLTLGSWLRSLRRPIVVADLSLRDWPLTLHSLVDMIRAAFRRFFRR